MSLAQRQLTVFGYSKNLLFSDVGLGVSESFFYRFYLTKKTLISEVGPGVRELGGSLAHR